MSPIQEVHPGERSILLPLFQSSKRDRVLIDSVLEGRLGGAY